MSCAVLSCDELRCTELQRVKQRAEQGFWLPPSRHFFCATDGDLCATFAKTARAPAIASSNKLLRPGQLSVDGSMGAQCGGMCGRRRPRNMPGILCEEVLPVIDALQQLATPIAAT